MMMNSKLSVMKKGRITNIFFNPTLTANMKKDYAKSCQNVYASFENGSCRNEICKGPSLQLDQFKKKHPFSVQYVIFHVQIEFNSFVLRM